MCEIEIVSMRCVNTHIMQLSMGDEIKQFLKGLLEIDSFQQVLCCYKGLQA